MLKLFERRLKSLCINYGFKIDKITKHRDKCILCNFPNWTIRIHSLNRIPGGWKEDSRGDKLCCSFNVHNLVELEVVNDITKTQSDMYLNEINRLSKLLTEIRNICIEEQKTYFENK